LVVSTLFGIVQGAQPGPVIRMSAPAGKKPLPVIVKVKAPAVVGGLGFVVRFAMTGVGATTLNGNVLELPPPFGLVTRTVQLSGSFCTVMVICNCVLLMNVTAAAGSVTEPVDQVSRTVGLFTKPVPLIVTVCPLVEPVTGFGLTLLIVGTARASLAERLRRIKSAIENNRTDLSWCLRHG
jgi:hypothetical protein